VIQDRVTEIVDLREFVGQTYPKIFDNQHTV